MVAHGPRRGVSTPKKALLLGCDESQTRVGNPPVGGLRLKVFLNESLVGRPLKADNFGVLLYQLLGQGLLGIRPRLLCGVIGIGLDLRGGESRFEGFF